MCVCVRYDLIFLIFPYFTRDLYDNRRKKRVVEDRSRLTGTIPDILFRCFSRELSLLAEINFLGASLGEACKLEKEILAYRFAQLAAYC